MVVLAVLSITAKCPVTPPEALSTDVVCEETPPVELHYELLALPDRAVSLAFAPVAAVIGLWERFRIVTRVFDLLRNDAGTVVLTPGIDVLGSDGFGGGATLSLISVLGDEERFDFTLFARANGETEAGFRYRHPLAAVNGRSIDVRFDYALDRDLPYFGIGNTPATQERVLSRQAFDVAAAFDLFGRGVLDFGGLVEVSWLRESLRSGDIPGVPSVSGDDGVGLPSGYGEPVHYGATRFELLYDSRDSAGHPTTGLRASVDVTAVASLNRLGLSSLAIAGSLGGFLPVLPDKRTLHLAVGGRAALSLLEGDAIPFHQLTVLGRRNHLRGFAKSRFRDRHGWWATAEYRFPIYEYLDSGIGASAAVFMDVGRVGGGPDELFDGPPRVSWGLTIRGGHDTVRFFDVDLGFSKEGIQLRLTVGGL